MVNNELGDVTGNICEALYPDDTCKAREDQRRGTLMNGPLIHGPLSRVVAHLAPHDMLITVRPSQTLLAT
jgi:hypothetical protein